MTYIPDRPPHPSIPGFLLNATDYQSENERYQKGKPSRRSGIIGGFRAELFIRETLGIEPVLFVDSKDGSTELEFSERHPNGRPIARLADQRKADIIGPLGHKIDVKASVIGEPVIGINCGALQNYPAETIIVICGERNDDPDVQLRGVEIAGILRKYCEENLNRIQNPYRDGPSGLYWSIPISAALREMSPSEFRSPLT
jgi:hypothetical protein